MESLVSEATAESKSISAIFGNPGISTTVTHANQFTALPSPDYPFSEPTSPFQKRGGGVDGGGAA
jgi:hypothetical protein